MKYVIFDLDATLCNDRHRKKYAESRKWDEYNQRCVSDGPHPVILRMAKILAKQYHLLYITGRNDDQFWQTFSWIRSQGLPIAPHQLLMRRKGDRTPSGELKINLLCEALRVKNPWSATEKVFCIFDDDPSVTRIFQGYGVTALQVHAGDDDE